MDKGRYFEKGRVYLKAGTWSIHIDVLVIPTIAAPLKNIPQRILYFRDPKMAHPISGSSSFAIDLLIGADFYWDIFENHIVLGKGPTAVASKLGYLLSGPLQSTKADKVAHMMNINITSLSYIIHISFDMEKFWKLKFIWINQEPTETNEMFKEETSLPTNMNIAKRRT